MITRPMLLDETGQKIKLALQRVKNKFLGTTTDPVTPGQAGSSGVSPVIQDDTGREIISALNDLADAVKPASTTEQGLVSTDDQEFAGSKTFVIPRVKQGASNVPAAIGYKTFDDIQNGMILMSTYNAHGRYSLYRFQFREYSLSSSTNEPLAFYDYFRLPVPDWDKTENTAYDIITTKNLTDIPDASATARGLVSTGAQTFAGDKTFTGNVFSTPAGNTEVNVGVNSSGGEIYLFSDPVNSRHGIYSAQGGWVIRIENERVRTYGNWAGTTIPVSKGGTGQTGQTAQQSYTPTVKIGTTTPTVSSLSAYYKSWGLMKLIGGRFNLTTTGTGSLIISLPAGFTVPTSAVQPMGILIAPDQKAYHIRVTADGLAAMSNGGSNVAWTAGYYCFWAVVMGD